MTFLKARVGINQVQGNLGLGWACCNGSRSWMRRGGRQNQWIEAIKNIFFTRGSGTEFLAFQGCQNPQNENGRGAHAPASLMGLAHGFGFYVRGQMIPTKETAQGLHLGLRAQLQRAGIRFLSPYQLWNPGGEERSTSHSPQTKDIPPTPMLVLHRSLIKSPPGKGVAAGLPLIPSLLCRRGGFR